MKLTILISFLIQLFEMGNKNLCKRNIINSPIDIGFPWTYLKFDIETYFNKIKKLQIKKKDHQTFIIDSKRLGKILYNKVEYIIDKVYLKNPSEHIMNDLRYSMEAQVIAKSKENNQIIWVFLFELIQDYSNPNLFPLGFGSGLLRKLKTFRENKHYRHEINVPFSLNYFLNENKKFLFYEGMSTNDSCLPTFYFISKETLWIGKEQLEEFDSLFPSKFKIKKRNNRIIYQNFIKPEDKYFYNIVNKYKISQSITPVEPEYVKYGFDALSNMKPLGYLNSNFWIPSFSEVIRKKLVKMKDIIIPKRKGPFKFIPLVYEENNYKNNTKSYNPLFFMTQQNYEFPKNGSVSSIPIYVRANYTLQNGIRPVILWDLPLYYKNMGHNNITNSDFDSNFIKVCNRWILKIVVNRNMDQEKVYKVNQEIKKNSISNVCKNYLFISKDGNLNKKTSSIKGNKLDLAFENFKANLSSSRNKYCKLYLSVILNNNNDKSLTDYFNTKCSKTYKELHSS